MVKVFLVVAIIWGLCYSYFVDILLDLEQGSYDKCLGLLCDKTGKIFLIFNFKATKDLSTSLIIYFI